MSMTITFAQLMAVIVTVVAAVGGLIKYIFYMIGKDREYYQAQYDHFEKSIQANNRSIEKLRQAVQDTRENYVTGKKLYTHEKEMKHLAERIFERLDKISAKVNQIIGLNTSLDRHTELEEDE